jgi:hypothetical protein
MLTDRTYGMTENQALVEGKNTLLKQGWRQFDGNMEVLYSKDKPVCLNLAVFRAKDDCLPTRLEALDVIVEILGLDHVGDVARWNDEPGRTLEEVIDVLDKAILQTAPQPREEKAQEIEMAVA